jgi:hypothetical protein
VVLLIRGLDAAQNARIHSSTSSRRSQPRGIHQRQPHPKEPPLVHLYPRCTAPKWLQRYSRTAAAAVAAAAAIAAVAAAAAAAAAHAQEAVYELGFASAPKPYD